MWVPQRGEVRCGRVPQGQTDWDEANMNDFTFAGGTRVSAKGYGACGLRRLRLHVEPR